MAPPPKWRKTLPMGGAPSINNELKVTRTTWGHLRRYSAPSPAQGGSHKGVSGKTHLARGSWVRHLVEHLLDGTVGSVNKAHPFPASVPSLPA